MEAVDLARNVGDRGMFNWLAGTAAAALYEEGRDWDAHAAVMAQALEAATLRADRQRLTSLASLVEFARGERLDENLSRVTELVGENTDVADLFALYMVRSHHGLVSGDLDTAYRSAMDVYDLHSQNPEVPTDAALHPAIWSRDLDRTRAVAKVAHDLRTTGPLTRTIVDHADAAVAALEGRTAEAVTGFRAARTTLLRFEQAFTAARYAVDAAVLLPDHPEVRAWADDARLVLEGLRARPYLEKLDEALAAPPSADRSSSVEARFEAPTGG
ncbi:MAG: hypothetical protein H0W98_06085 [Chloroflexi bacterium]|nr:hypothetical protein [Chloroflexota bacterium]